MIVGFSVPNVANYSDGPWNDIIIPAFSLGTGASAPDLVNFLDTGNLTVYGFNGAGSTPIEQLYGSFEFFHGWKEGSTISIHVHWVPTVSSVGNVKWQLEYSWANSGAVFPAVTVISVTTASGGTAWTHLKSEFPDVVGTGFTIGSTMNFRLFRDPGDVADTYTDDAGLLSIGIHHQCDTIGSVQRTTKT
jgi:hypothetical protein